MDFLSELPLRMVEAVLDSLPVPAAVIGSGGDVIHANPGWSERVWFDLKAVISSPDVSPRLRASLDRNIDDVLNGVERESTLTFPPGFLVREQNAIVTIKRLAGSQPPLALATLQVAVAPARVAGSNSEPETESGPGLFEMDLDGNVTGWTPAAAELFNLPASEVHGQKAARLFAKQSMPFPEPDLVHRIREKGTQKFESRLRRHPDSFFDGQITLSVRTAPGGDEVLICEANLLSERQRAGSLRRSEERLRYALEAASDGIWDWDLRTDRLVFTSRAMEIIGESSTREGIRSTQIDAWNERIHPGDARSHEAALQAHFDHETPTFESEFRLRDNRGGWKWVLIRGRATERDAKERPLRMVGTITDISERKLAEDALSRSEERYRNLFAYASDAVVLFDIEENAILDANMKAEEVFGYSAGELKAMSIRDLHPEDSWPRMERELNGPPGGTGALFEIDGIRRGGRRIPLEVNIRIVEYGGRKVLQSFIRDITERRNLEFQLLQSQKMETVGRLAGGIAHDFNNILTAIQGFTALLSGSLEDGSEERGMADEVLRSVQRASRLTMQLLAFSRRDIPNRTKLDMNAIVRDMEKLLKRVIGEHIALETDLDPDLGLIEGDGGSMEQVITNLAVNSTDAMPEGGRLRISTANVVFEEKSPDRPAEAEPGTYVMLAVSDEGEGIPASVLPQIFEPFFTTKVRGTGTGLGLATVYGIVRRSNGHIIVTSESGRGTEIRIYLPRVAGGAETGRTTPRPARAEGGTEMVLVVEDEPAVRSLARRFLETAGYTVAEASNAAEAMVFVEANPGKIELLLTDVIMPEQSGPELAKRVRVIQPDVRILYMSGYPGEFIARHGVSNAELGYLQKPFSQEQIIMKTREVLDAPRRTQSFGAATD